jgi:hypothetical protein
MTQEQYSDLQRYIPESDTVKMVFEEMHPDWDFSDWDKAVFTLVDRALTEDKDALMNLLELVYLNAHNEGMIEATADGYEDRKPA